MARCDEGYRCDVCGEDVENLTDSDLYLRFILGEITLEWLHRLPERHIRCNPTLAQYIDDPRFPPIEAEGPFHKKFFDDRYTQQETERVTRAWQRLCYIPRSGWSIPEYPFTVTPFDPKELDG